jgi:hypothetical protein
LDFLAPKTDGKKTHPTSRHCRDINFDSIPRPNIIAVLVGNSGGPDWAIFRPMRERLLWVVTSKLSSPHFWDTLFIGYICINSDKKLVGLHFGRIFHKLIGHPGTYVCMKYEEENYN